jgi:5'-nucleotidase
MGFPSKKYQNKLFTASGQFVDVGDPDPETIRMDDIAQGLSRQFRFGGFIGDYTVAQHSVAVASCVYDNWPGDPERGLREALRLALLHDAAEAYVRDMPSPAKRLMPDYRQVEDRLFSAILKRFGVSRDWSDRVLEADLTLCGLEARMLLPREPEMDEKVPPVVLHVDNSLVLPAWDMDRAAHKLIQSWWRLDEPLYTLRHWREGLHRA